MLAFNWLAKSTKRILTRPAVSSGEDPEQQLAIKSIKNTVCMEHIEFLLTKYQCLYHPKIPLSHCSLYFSLYFHPMLLLSQSYICIKRVVQIQMFLKADNLRSHRVLDGPPIPKCILWPPCLFQNVSSLDIQCTCKQPTGKIWMTINIILLCILSGGMTLK